MADVDTDADYEGDHEAVIDGYFHESAEGFRSAPYFDVQIDGITLLDTCSSNSFDSMKNQRVVQRFSPHRPFCFQ